MKGKLLVSALEDGASEPVHRKIKIGDYAGANGGNYSYQFKNLDKLVRSSNTEFIAKKYTVSKPAGSNRGEVSRRTVNEPNFEFFVPRGPQTFSVGIPPINPNRGSDIVPGACGGMYPRRGGFSGDGSMLIGPNDPRWFGGDGEPGFLGVNSLVPSGARFDPYGPPGTPGFEPNRFGRCL